MTNPTETGPVITVVVPGVESVMTKRAKSPKAHQAHMVDSGDDTHFVAVVSKFNLVGNNPKEWWVDTGAISHICTNTWMFKTYTAVKDEDCFMGHSATSKVEGNRTMVLKKTSKKELTLTDVLHVPDIRKVFGGVVGGITTLSVMEKVPIDDDDRPLEEIKKTGVTVFVNLYSEPDEEEEKEKQKAEKNVDEEENAKVKSWFSNPGTGEAQSGVVGGGIGKYLKTGKENLESIPEQDSQKAVTKKKKVGVSAGLSA